MLSNRFSSKGRTWYHTRNYEENQLCPRWNTYSKIYCTVCPWQGFDSRGATSALCEEERPGLLCFRNNWCQLTPTNQLQGMAGPRSQHGGTCMEMYLREDEICYTGSEKKYCENQLCESLGQGRQSGRRCSGYLLEQIPTLQPVEDPTLEHWSCSLWKIHIETGLFWCTADQVWARQSVRRKDQQRGLTTGHSLNPQGLFIWIYSNSGRKARSSKWKSEVEPWEKEEMKGALFIFASCYPNLS